MCMEQAENIYLSSAQKSFISSSKPGLPKFSYSLIPKNVMTSHQLQFYNQEIACKCLETNLNFLIV